MIRNYLIVALRNFDRHRVYSLINVFGLALGMACCLLIWTWVKHELSFDRFYPNAERIGRIIAKHNYPNGDPLFGSAVPFLMTPRLVADYPEIEAAVRMRPLTRTLVTFQDKAIYEQGMFLADSSIFDVLSYPLVSGDPTTALAGVNNVVIDQELASRYFGDEGAIGRTLRLDNRLDVMVTGVMKRIPVNSHIRPRILISMGTLDQFMDPDFARHWAYNAFYTYLLLRPGVSMVDFEVKFTDALHRYRTEGTIIDLQLQKLTDIHFGRIYQADIAAHGSNSMILLFSIISGFVLIIAAVNFINLSTARAAKRVVEVSIRKVVGANRSRLVRQFLGESLLLSTISAVVALLIVELTLPIFIRISGQSIAFSLFSDFQSVLFLTTMIILMGLAAGAYPALYLSSLKPVRGLRNRSASAGIRPRGLLVMAQFTIAIAMIIGTTVVYKQLTFAQTRELGYQTGQVLTFTLDGREAQSRYGALNRELVRLPDVVGVTASAQLPNTIGWAATMWPEGAGEAEKIQFSLNPVDTGYFATYGMTLLTGDPLRPAGINDSITPIVINEEAARRLGWTEPVGRLLYGEGDARLRVVGMVRDFQFASVRTSIQPLLLFYDSSFFNTVGVKIATGNIPGVIEQIRTTWERVIPGRPFEYAFLDDTFDAIYQAERRMGQVLWIFTVVSILIACLGLLGLAAYSVEQRTKETGIRKALGASIGSLVVMHSIQFVRWIAAANVIAWPVSYLLLQRWLADFAYRTTLDWWVFGLSGFGALLIAVLTAATLAIKASLANPVDSLRYE